MKTVAIIQARMGSSRLPGKAMIDLCGKPSLQRVLERVSKSKVDAVVVATEPKSQEILEFCSKTGTDVFIGSEDDVMCRVIEAADAFGANVVVDITGDCPLVDPELINRCVDMLLSNTELDYVSNCVPIRSYPDGMDVQVYYREVLEAVENITDSKSRNHVGWNIPQHPLIFNFHCIKAGTGYYRPNLRLTLDTDEDLRVIRILQKECGPDATLKDYLIFIDTHIGLLTNQNVRTKTPEEG